MIEKIEIKNFKSIADLSFELGRVNVLIGANGTGKSNILEAIAFGGAAAADKLDNEFLAPRGIRVTETDYMKSGFQKPTSDNSIEIEAKTNEGKSFRAVLNNPKSAYPKWQNYFLDRAISIHSYFIDQQSKNFKDSDIYQLLDEAYDIDVVKILMGYAENSKEKEEVQKYLISILRDTILSRGKASSISSFFIYTPENTTIRNFQKEGQIQPLGINGEGLFKLLQVLAQTQPEKLAKINEKLRLIEWFDGFEMPTNLIADQAYLKIKDRYLDQTLQNFDQRSSNEGFLFLLFYFTLFIADETPKFFAVDNVDAALNPKLAAKLMQELVVLSKEHDKQVILTTHNPALLDGLDLNDDEVRLFVVYRSVDGHTTLKRVKAPKPLPGQEPVALSEAFLRGYIGGLPSNF